MFTDVGAFKREEPIVYTFQNWTRLVSRIVCQRSVDEYIRNSVQLSD